MRGLIQYDYFKFNSQRRFHSLDNEVKASGFSKEIEEFDEYLDELQAEEDQTEDQTDEQQEQQELNESIDSQRSVVSNRFASEAEEDKNNTSTNACCSNSSRDESSLLDSSVQSCVIHFK